MDFVAFKNNKRPAYGWWILVTTEVGYKEIINHSPSEWIQGDLMADFEKTEHLWLVKTWDEDKLGNFWAFDSNGNKIDYITHWKYALWE